MIRRQTNKLNMYEGVKVLLNLNSSIWATNTAVSTCVTAFNGYITAINTNNTAQKTSTKGTTQTKQIARLKMIQATIAIASAGKAYATVTIHVVVELATNVFQVGVSFCLPKLRI